MLWSCWTVFVQPKFALYGHNWQLIMIMTWKPSLNHPVVNCSTSQDRKGCLKFSRMWRFCISNITFKFTRNNPRETPSFIEGKYWLLLHDNALAHRPLLVANLAPCEFFLYSILKRPTKVWHYATIEEIETASTMEIKKINDEMFFWSFWKKRKCIKSHWDYFQGCKINIH